MFTVCCRLIGGCVFLRGLDRTKPETLTPLARSFFTLISGSHQLLHSWQAQLIEQIGVLNRHAEQRRNRIKHTGHQQLGFGST
ncbi:hypothetical protein SAMN05428959_1011086 [Duganella sp. CF517]|nr:hypothetical protein SAMN05428959_1011086 [Duganella sp. CF517]